MKRKRLFSIVLSAALLIGSAAALPQSRLTDSMSLNASAAISDIKVTRFAGNNRAETAALISNAAKGGMYKSADTVVIATGFDFHDALAAVPLASAYNAPLLLSDRDNLSDKTLAEIKRLKANDVIVVASSNSKDQNGNSAAIKRNVYKQLSDYNVTRLEGSSYYETAKKVAQQLQKKTNKAPGYVFFTTDKNYADALSVSPVAAILKAPIFYVDPKGKLNANTTYYLNSVKKNVNKIFIVGGENAVSNDVVKKIKAVLPGKTVQRFAGTDRYETCIRINKAFKSSLPANTVCIAKGYNFPDALAGGVYAAQQKAPLFLADKLDAKATLSKNQAAYLYSKNPGKLYIFGGESAVPNALVTNIKKAISQSPNKVAWRVTNKTFHYYKNSIDDYEYYGIIEIENTGKTNLYLADCKFNLEDNKGHILQVDDFISTCPDIIAPGEKGYFYNNIGSTSLDDGISLKNGLKLVPEYEIKVATGKIVDYPVSDTRMIKDNYGRAKFVGRIENKTKEDDSMVYVEAIMYDANGKVLAITGTNVMGLKAKSKTSFEISTWFSDDTIKPEQIKSFKIMARQDYYQFD